MDYQQFILVTKEAIEKSLTEGMRIQIHTTLKNNGRERIGLTITDVHTEMSPTIYLEEYFEQFQNGLSIDWIASNILSVYDEVKSTNFGNVHIVQNFETCRSKIVYKIIHQKRNETLLTSTPFVPYLDFAIVFYILFDVSKSGTASILITDQLLSVWGKSLEDIKQAAFINTPKLLPASFKKMQTVIDELEGVSHIADDAVSDFIYILTNPLRSFGASCILYDGMLKKMWEEIGENYYLIPSSIHEMIIIPESSSPSFDMLTDMLREVNASFVEKEDFLSDHIYYYDHTAHTLT